MPIVRGIFSSPDRIHHPVVSGVIKMATNSKLTHAAVGFGNRMIEAVPPKVCWSPGNKYDQEPVLEILNVTVSQVQYEAGLAAAEKLIGVPYGFDDLLIGGLNDMIGEKVGKGLADHLDVKHTLDCSALYTIVFRAMIPSFLEGYEPSMITPRKAYKATKKYLDQHIWA